MNRTNHLIAVEGIDGTGKTSVTKKLAQQITAQYGEGVLNETTQQEVKEKLRPFFNPDDLDDLCKKIVPGGAIRFEDHRIKNPTDSLKRNVERDFGIDMSFYVYLLSSLYKNKIIQTLLPYTTIVCDRHIYSVFAHHNAYGANLNGISIENLPLLLPDRNFLLITEETERRRRLIARGKMNPSDKLEKKEGSIMDIKEKTLRSFDPHIIDTTRKNEDETVAEILEVIYEKHAHIQQILSQQEEKGVEQQQPGFDSERYLNVQLDAILEKASTVPEGGNVYIEFGGKPIDDQHAMRVLPGYDPDLKIRLLEKLAQDFEIIVVVNARDLLKPRIRGDSQLFYNKETIRLVHELRDRGIDTNHGVIAQIKEDFTEEERHIIEEFKGLAQRSLGMEFIEHMFIPNYPDPSIITPENVFSQNPKLQTKKKHILVVSPGGGSGKFGVCLSELCRDFQAGKNSIHVKFETFPVFNLPPNHPVNVAFAAATADLHNIVAPESENGLTSYDKDIENFQLLQAAITLLCPNPSTNPMTTYLHPSDMGVNRLTMGFTNEDIINKAALREIRRRLTRYTLEIEQGIEYPATLTHLETLLTALPHHLLPSE